MTSGHDRIETLVFAGIALAFASAMYAMSVTSERGPEGGPVADSPSPTMSRAGGE